MANAVSKQAPLAALVCAVLAGCASIGPEALQQNRTDRDTKATFSLLMELARLELSGKIGPGPVLTLPVGGR
jgi:hypothetical protein